MRQLRGTFCLTISNQPPTARVNVQVKATAGTVEYAFGRNLVQCSCVAYSPTQGFTEIYRANRHRVVLTGR